MRCYEKCMLMGRNYQHYRNYRNYRLNHVQTFTYLCDRLQSSADLCVLQVMRHAVSLQQLVERIAVTVKTVFFSGHSIGLHVAQSLLFGNFSPSALLAQIRLRCTTQPLIVRMVECGTCDHDEIAGSNLGRKSQHILLLLSGCALSEIKLDRQIDRQID